MESQNNNMEISADPFNGIGNGERSQTNKHVRIFRGILVAIVVITAVAIGVWLGMKDDTSNSSFQTSNARGPDDPEAMINSTTTSNMPSQAPPTTIISSVSPSSRPTLTPTESPSAPPTIIILSPTSSRPTFTPSASAAPSNQRCNYLESVLGDRALLHPLAIDWMCNIDTWEPTTSEEDATQLLISKNETDHQAWLDRYAVTTFFYASNNDHTDTFDHYNLAGASTKSTCEWYRISCHGENNNTITEVILGGSKIANLQFFDTASLANNVGYLPTTIGLLTMLTRLSNVRTSAQSLPTEIGLLTALTQFRTVSYSDGGFVSTIPTEIGTLTRLEKLFLLSDSLVGTIPSEIGNLDKLINLRIDRNRLEGTIPSEIGKLSQLEYIDIAFSNITGTIPSEIGNWSKLQKFRLFLDNLIGSIPTEIGMLEKLTHLRLAASLDGSIPSEVGNCGELNTFMLPANNLDGSIPSEIGNLDQLSYLDLFNNNLKGTLPTSIVALTNLGILSLMMNRLTGTVPPMPTRFPSIDDCFLQYNCFDNTTNGIAARCTVYPPSSSC